ncbi:hypothetical protein [Kitasatospora aureofaciens]
MASALEPKGKLDTVATPSSVADTAQDDAVARVNGPEGDFTDWQSIDWQGAEKEVRRLRQRIFTAT